MITLLADCVANVAIYEGALTVMCLCSYESSEVLGYVIPLYRTLNGLLILLLIMHCYWFALITRIAYRTVVYGDIDDVREGGSDED